MKRIKITLLTVCLLLVLGFVTTSVVGYFQGVYADRQKTRLAEVIALINEKVDGIITPQAIAQKNIPSDILNPEQFPYIKMLYVSPVGDIVFLSVKDHLVWLHPSIQNNRVEWRCYAAPINLSAFGCSR